MRYRDTWDIYRDIINIRYLRYFENLFQLSSSSSSGGFLGGHGWTQTQVNVDKRRTKVDSENFQTEQTAVVTREDYICAAPALNSQSAAS